MRSESGDQESAWQDNWFIQNWVGAIPVIRSIQKKSLSEAVDMAAMDTSMIVGGFVFMQFNLFDVNMMDSSEKPKLEMLGEMVTGMGAGMFAYHNAREAMKYAYSKVCGTCQTQEYQPF